MGQPYFATLVFRRPWSISAISCRDSSGDTAAGGCSTPPSASRRCCQRRSWKPRHASRETYRGWLEGMRSNLTTCVGLESSAEEMTMKRLAFPMRPSQRGQPPARRTADSGIKPCRTAPVSPTLRDLRMKFFTLPALLAAALVSARRRRPVSADDAWTHPRACSSLEAQPRFLVGGSRADLLRYGRRPYSEGASAWPAARPQRDTPQIYRLPLPPGRYASPCASTPIDKRWHGERSSRCASSRRAAGCCARSRSPELRRDASNRGHA